MHKMAIPKDIEQQKYLTVVDAVTYFQLGRSSLYKVAEECQALKRIGRRVLIDKDRLTDYIDAK